MFKKTRPARPVVTGIHTSKFRRRLAHYIGLVRYAGDFVAIHRKGADSVFLISQADFDLLSDRITDLEYGKLNPATGSRRGGLWQLLNWEWHEDWITRHMAAKARKPKRQRAVILPPSPAPRDMATEEAEAVLQALSKPTPEASAKRDETLALLASAEARMSEIDKER